MSLLLLLIPLIGIGFVTIEANYGLSLINNIRIKSIALITSIVNLIVSLIMFILFDFSSKQYQFIEEHYQISYFDIYLGVDGLSIYFVLLTTIIMPIAILSNWNSIQSQNVLSFVVIMLLLETLLLAVFLVLDILLFYIFFESILPPLFLLIGLFGSSNKVRASFYLFLYTLSLQCIRAKLRGSPKALITKDLKETLNLAKLITMGKVTSLKIIKWMIADLSQITSLFVKEQRADGSLIPVYNRYKVNN